MHEITELVDPMPDPDKWRAAQERADARNLRLECLKVAKDVSAGYMDGTLNDRAVKLAEAAATLAAFVLGKDPQ